jgi:microcystin-dependent protein
MAYMGTNAPTGWLLCNGNAVSRTNYAALFAVIGTASGQGDGSTTFNLPDMRGVFLRGVDNNAGNDPDTLSRTNQNAGGNLGDTVGSYQSDQLKAHQHDNGAVTCGEYFFNGGSAGTGYNIYGNATLQTVPSPASGWGLEAEYSGYTGPQGGSETRPKNVYVNYIIKY